MKSLTLLFLLLFACLNLVAQEPVKKVHFGISINPQMNFSSFDKAPNVEIANSFCLGVSGDVYFDITSRFQFKTGMGIQYLTLNHRDRSARWPHQGQNGQWEPDQSFIGYNSKYLFAGIPFQFSVKTTDKPNHIYLSGSVNPNIVINHTGEIVTNEAGHITKYETAKELYEPGSVLTTIGFGIGYEKAIGKTKIFVEPNFHYSAGLFFKDSSISSRANGHISLFGLKVGVVI